MAHLGTRNIHDVEISILFNVFVVLYIVHYICNPKAFLTSTQNFHKIIFEQKKIVDGSRCL